MRFAGSGRSNDDDEDAKDRTAAVAIAVEVVGRPRRDRDMATRPATEEAEAAPRIIVVEILRVRRGGGLRRSVTIA